MRSSSLIFALVGAMVSGAAARAACDRHPVAEIPVTMKGARGLRPMVDVRVNGAEARMLFDTGASGTVVFPDATAKLKLRSLPGQATARSLGRTYATGFAVADEIVFADTTRHNVEVSVPPGGFGPGIDGLLGHDQLGGADLEIDLAHGVIRLFAPKGCETADLAYWRGGQPASVIEIEGDSAGLPRVFGTARVNGVPLRVLFDTGSPDSHVTYEASLRAGIDPAAAESGARALDGGVGVGGGQPMTSWRVRFDRFQIGDERTPDALLEVVEKPNANSDMIVGADFFVAHRVFISRSQHKLYFTANPGVAYPRPPDP